MEYKNKLNKIKAILSLEVKLAQIKLDDGITVIEAEQFAPDYSVGIVTSDGVVPMPIGDYTLEDGSMLMVEVEGIISSIMSAQEAEAEVEIEVEVAPQGVTQPDLEAASPAQPKRIVESVSKESFFAEIEKLRAEFALQLEKVQSEKAALEVKLSSIEAGANPIMHNPESGETKQFVKLSKNKVKSIEDTVFSKIFNK